VYWEMTLWDLKVPAVAGGPGGMLFWRMHRCGADHRESEVPSREMTPQQWWIFWWSAWARAFGRRAR